MFVELDSESIESQPPSFDSRGLDVSLNKPNPGPIRLPGLGHENRRALFYAENEPQMKKLKCDVECTGGEIGDER